MSIARDNIEQLLELDREQQEWLIRNNKYLRKMQGEPYNDNQLAQLKERGLEPVALDWSTPTVSTLASNFHSDKSGCAVVPIGESDRDLAYLLQALHDGYREFNAWESHYWRILQETVSVGIGMAHVDRADNIYGCQTTYRSFNNYRWPAGHNSMFWDDLNRLIYFTWMPIREAMRLYGMPFRSSMEAYTEIVNKESQYYTKFHKDWNKNRGDKVENHDCMVVEAYEIEMKDHEELLFPDGSSTIIPVLSKEELVACEDDKLQNAYSYFIKNTRDPQYAQDITMEIKEYGDLTIKPIARCIKRISVGDYPVGNYELPCKRIPVMPFIYDLIGYPEGELRRVDLSNQAANQTLLLLINNGRLLSNPKILAKNGSIDYEKYIKALSMPFGVIEWKDNSLGADKNAAPVPINPYPVGPHFVELIELLRNSNEYSTGIYSGFQGNPQGALETYSTTTSLNNLALQKIVPKAKSLQIANAKLGGIELDFIREYTDYDLVMKLKITNDELFHNIQERGIGTAENGNGYNMVLNVNSRSTEQGKRKLKNNLKDAKNIYNFAVRSAPYMHSHRERLSSDLRLMAQQIGDPIGVKLAYEQLAKVTEAPFAEDMAKKMNVVEQLSQELEAEKMTVKNLTEDLQNASKQRETARIAQQVSAVKSDAQNKVNKIINDFKLWVDGIKQKQETMTTEEMADVQTHLDEFIQALEAINQNTQTNQPDVSQQTQGSIGG